MHFFSLDQTGNPVFFLCCYRVFLIHGTKDEMVEPGALDVIYDYYYEFLDDPEHQILVNDGANFVQAQNQS